MFSPFAPKLGTNYCVNDEEFAEITALLADPTLRLKHLDNTIADMRTTLAKLEDERVALSAYVDAHRALISPARRLPPDLIREIFVACLPTQHNCVMSATEVPVVLGRICSAWRIVSHSTPRLWSSLHIVEPRFPNDSPPGLAEEKLKQRLETTRTWLARSGQCALSISLYCHPDSPGFSPSAQHLFMQAILPFASRWEHINFATPPLTLGTLSHFTASDVPMLKSVAIQEFHDPALNAPSVQRGPWGVLRGSVSSFSVCMSNYTLLELPLRWNRLTNLSISAGWTPAGIMTSEIARQLLVRCPELRICQLQLFVHHDEDDNTTVESRLELSFLHTLDIKCFGTLNLVFTPPHLLYRVSFPQLRHFKFRGLHTDGDVSYAQFLAATPHLETLDLNIEALTRSSLPEFFRGLPPTIRKLKFIDFSTYRAGTDVFNEDILALLTGPCCPSLQELHIDNCCFFSDKDLLHFINSRMTAGLPTLKRVEIKFHRKIQVDILPNLHQFIESGLYVNLTYTPPPAVRVSPWEGLHDTSVPTVFQNIRH
ncbi:hypothetical protein DFH09DRAFT_1457540 [Mycena vulgaris]|nr:hypothetical protein DFH09DRAFT_1457540 [Mycena vulgaris]